MKLASAPLILTVLIGSAPISSFAQCLTFDSVNYPVFKSLYYVTRSNTAGDAFVVGAFDMPGGWQKLSNIPLPTSPNQKLCGTVYVAPGIRAQVYVPTSAERSGDFSHSGVQLVDPTTGMLPVLPGTIPPGATPFAGGFIPAARLGGIWAWRVASFQYTSTVAGALAITSASSLPAPMVSSAYNQQLSAVGGLPPYTWSVTDGALPSGLSLSAGQGTISGVLTTALKSLSIATIQVTDAASGTGELVFSFGLELQSGQTRAGVFPQVAVGAGWTTTIYLSNGTNSPAKTTVSFRSDDGNALSLPLALTVDGSTQRVTAPSAAATILPNSLMVIEAASDSHNSSTGWAEVTSTGTLSGYAVFRATTGSGPSSEGTAPLERSYQTAFSLIYDNTNGQKTAIATANLDAGSAPLVISAYDEDGSLIDGAEPDWPAGNGYGHTSFMLTDLLPKTAGHLGVVVFSTPLLQQYITGLGLRVSATGSFSSTPKQAAPGQ